MDYAGQWACCMIALFGVQVRSLLATVRRCRRKRNPCRVAAQCAPNVMSNKREYGSSKPHSRLCHCADRGDLSEHLSAHVYATVRNRCGLYTRLICALTVLHLALLGHRSRERCTLAPKCNAHPLTLRLFHSSCPGAQASQTSSFWPMPFPEGAAAACAAGARSVRARSQAHLPAGGHGGRLDAPRRHRLARHQGGHRSPACCTSHSTVSACCSGFCCGSRVLDCQTPSSSAMLLARWRLTSTPQLAAQLRGLEVPRAGTYLAGGQAASSARHSLAACCAADGQHPDAR